MAGDNFVRRTGGVTGIRIAVRTVRQSRMRASCTPPPTPASAPPSTSLASPTCLSGASGHRSAAGSPRPPAGAGGAADQLVDALVTNLGGLPGSPVPPAPPADAFYTRLGIRDRQATIGWATTLQRLNLVVEETEPGLADAEQRLLLRVTAGWPDGAGCNVLRSAPPDSPPGATGRPRRRRAGWAAAGPTAEHDLDRAGRLHLEGAAPRDDRADLCGARIRGGPARRQRPELHRHLHDHARIVSRHRRVAAAVVTRRGPPVASSVRATIRRVPTRARAVGTL
jgi:hypothetical protein